MRKKIFENKNNLCQQCFSKNRRKTERPEVEILKKQVEELGFVGTGKLYNVSDNAVRKWMGLKK